MVSAPVSIEWRGSRRIDERKKELAKLMIVSAAHSCVRLDPREAIS
jgi:hypothetical protein